jgi:signal transduction histidine kinase
MRDMRSPLTFTISYSDALITRIQSPKPYPEELVEFGKIIRNGVVRALDQWESLYALYQTDPRRDEQIAWEKVALAGAIKAAITELVASKRASLPRIDLSLPPNLPPVRARAKDLLFILTSLLQESISRLEKDGSVKVSAAREGNFVQTNLTLLGGQVLVRAYLFDAMPLSTVEQTIIMYGGRLWVENEPGKSTTFSFTLPAWM